MQFDTPSLLHTLWRSSPADLTSAKPLQDLTIFHVWVEKAKNKTKKNPLKPWPLKNRLVKSKGQFSWNRILNCSAQGPQLLSSTPFGFINFWFPWACLHYAGEEWLHTLGYRTISDMETTRGRSHFCRALAAHPLSGHPAWGIAARTTTSSWAAFSASSLPPVSTVLCATLGCAQLCLRLLCWLVTDELDSLHCNQVTEHYLACESRREQALSKSHS